MRYLKYIILSLITSILAVSCLDELSDPQSMAGNDEVTLVPRVRNFTNQYVTKADGDWEKETKITSLVVLVFNNDGILIYKREGTSDLSLNKSMLNTTAQKDKLTEATVVMIANMSLDILKDSEGETMNDNIKNLTLSTLDGYTCDFYDSPVFIADITSESFKGFPMIGRSDKVDLSTGDNSANTLEVALQILYAKVNFNISVTADGENTGTGMSFQLSNYTVHNIATKTPVAQPTGSTYSSDNYTYTSANEGATDGNIANITTELDDENPLSFTFYMAETRYTPGSTTGIYPLGLPDDHKQQYKPQLAVATTGDPKPAAGLATYVLLNGEYTDYRDKVWTVNYKVYLGKDNHSNFEVDRNSEYTNYITIKGIRDNASHTDREVWFDHRVVASTETLADNIAITRETLIDSHIEVRPLRVKWGTVVVDGVEKEKYSGVRVYLPTKSDGTLVDWIGIERFTGKNCQDRTTYCYQNGKSIGKRRFFTHNLISELQAIGGDLGVQTSDEGKYIYLLNNECAYIYIDENTFEGPRDAVISLQFYGNDGNVVGEPEAFKLIQNGLHKVANSNLYIETYEEYLHTYDSQDLYTNPLTDYTQNGYEWGLKGETLSNTENVVLTGSSTSTSYYYDYFHAQDKTNYKPLNLGTYEVVGGNISINNGLNFTNKAGISDGMTIIDMNTIPSSAIQYCLSKNKFKMDEGEEEKHTMDIHWYLPDVYETISMLSNAKETFTDFAKYSYWTSQPSWTTPSNLGGLNYLVDDTANARSVSIEAAKADNYTGTNTLRDSKHRIRCAYSETGIGNVDFSGERAPEGTGGNYSFIMKGYINNLKAGYGYFMNSVKSLSASEYNNTRLQDPPEYPKQSNSSSNDAEFRYVFDIDINNNPIQGFEVNPRPVDNPKKNWEEYVISLGTYEYKTGYYKTLAKYPGLSEKVLQKFGRSALDATVPIPVIGELSLLKAAEYFNINVDDLLLIDAYQELTAPLSAVDTVTNSLVRRVTQEFAESSNLDYLDNYKGGNMFVINFGKKDGKNNPTYIYDETVSGTVTNNTYNWDAPDYTSKTHDLYPQRTPSSQSATGNGKEINTNVTRDLETARSNARGRAESTARTDALNNLKTVLDSFNETDSGWEYDGEPSVVFSNYNYTNESKVVVYWSSTCSVTATASAYFKKAGSKTLYTQTSGGEWVWVSSADPKPLDTGIQSDELRIYSGNSFTISLSDQTDEDGVQYNDGYEITKVKVHYSGDNYITEKKVQSGTFADTYTYYARFVDSNSKLPYFDSNILGMEYQTNGEGKGTQQWSGSGTTTVTLVLADYINKRATLATTYEYAKASVGLNKYIVIDKIEVKCTKKAPPAGN